MDRILLAVSGGIDSMYLANRAPELFPGARFGVAHCNFGLRGEESDGDEAFVRAWCGRRGLPFHLKRFDTRAWAAEHGQSIEMAARELRYAWFDELCREHGYEAVAVAHNADDNAETLILNLLKTAPTPTTRRNATASATRSSPPSHGSIPPSCAPWAMTCAASPGWTTSRTPGSAPCGTA